MEIDRLAYFCKRCGKIADVDVRGIPDNALAALKRRANENKLACPKCVETRTKEARKKLKKNGNRSH